MTTDIGTLNFTAYQGGGKGTLIAQVNLDASVDTDFSVPINGNYSNQDIYADGVIVYNTNNNGVVVIRFGTLETDIPPFTRDYVQLGSAAGQSIEIKFTVGTISLLFYKGTPPVNPSLINYAGAQAVANSTVFIAGTTTGTPNAQAVGTNNNSNYSFTNGVLVSGTWGFTNTGALTLNINGSGAVPVNKPSPLGPVPLVSGEAVAGQNFIVSCNTTTGNFDLVSDFNIGTVLTNALTADISLNNATYTIGPNVAQGNVGIWYVSGTIIFEDGVGNTQVFGQLTDGTTVIASGVGYTNGTQGYTLALSGVITNPAGNLRLSGKSTVNGSTVLIYNRSGLAKDGTITARRIA